MAKGGTKSATGTHATPVLVGVAQLEQRLADWREHKEPLDLMFDALQSAAVDCTNPTILDQASSIRVIRGIWPYSNPAGVLKERLGLTRAETGLSQYGGNFVQSVVNQSALDIQAGTHEIILITGAECGATQAKARRTGNKLRWNDPGGTPDRLFGDEVAMTHDEEKLASITSPIHMYPLFETALRHALGESPEQHAQRISELWAGFSQVAASNPNAWLREPRSAAEIRTVSEKNRAVSSIYPKLMNSNNNVDQAAALIMCSTTVATKLGIPEAKWVYPWAGTDAHDTYFVSNRDALHESPAIRIAGNRCMDLAGVSPGELTHVDLYSCFPVAVQVAARELGIAQDRPLTVTGGLTFAGGPLNNYVMHSIARTVELARAEPAERNLVTANGGYLTKHAFGVYSGQAPQTPFQHADVQAEVDALKTRELVVNYRGTAQIESYAVMMGEQGPQVGQIAARTPTGERAWASTTDPAALAQMIETDMCESPVKLADRIATL